MPADAVLGSPVAESRPLGGEATYLRLADGRELVLKGVPRQTRHLWQPGSAWAELILLDLLSAEGAPVPRLVAADPRAGWLLRSFAPGLPLSSALQTEAGALFKPCLDALLHVEEILRRDVDYIAPYTTSEAPATWQSMISAMRGLLTPTAQSVWDELAREVLQTDSLTLGLLDVNAENAVWHEGSVTLIDLATVGPDFIERRLAAYLQAAAPRPASALTEEAYAFYLETRGLTAALRLALFDLLFWAVVLSRLKVMQTSPHRPAAARLRNAWGDPAALWDAALAAWHRRRFQEPGLATITAGLRLDQD